MVSPLLLASFSFCILYAIGSIIYLFADNIVCALSKPKCVVPVTGNTLSYLSNGNGSTMC